MCIVLEPPQRLPCLSVVYQPQLLPTPTSYAGIQKARPMRRETCRENIITGMVLRMHALRLHGGLRIQNPQTSQPSKP